MSQENVQLVRKSLDEVFSQGNFDSIPQFFNARLVDVVRKGLRERRAAFPDLKFDITHTVDEGDHVAFRYTAKGTHQGTFQGIAATGKPVRWEGCAIVRIAQGRVIEMKVDEEQGWGKIIQMGRFPKLRKQPKIGGRWTASQENVNVTLDLAQVGSNVSGRAKVSGFTETPSVSGSFHNPEVRLQGSIAGMPFAFEGKLVNASQIDGRLSGAVTLTTTLRKSQ